MSLWGSQYAAGIKELLKGLDDANLRGMASTACNNRLAVATSKDYAEIILRYTDSLEKFFSHQTVKAKLLRDYLYKRNLPIIAVETRPQMIERVKQIWSGMQGAAVGTAGGVTCLWKCPEAPNVKKVLKCFDEPNLKALAITACSNRITGYTTNDHIEIILRWTDSLQKFFSYKRVSAKLLRDYLYKMKLPISATDKKPVLVARVMELWFGSSYVRQHYTEPFNISADHYIEGNYTEALANAREAVGLDMTGVEGYIFVGKCNIALGNASVALSVLRQAEQLDQGNQAVQEEISRAQSLISCQEEIDKALREEDYRTAMQHLDRALDLAPGCKDLKVKKAECLLLLKKYDEAKQMTNEVFKLDKNNVDAMYVEGMCLYYGQDDLEESLNRFRQVLRLEPDHAKAREVFKKVKQLKQKKKEGNEAFKKGQYEEAIRLYTEALAIDSHNKFTNAKLFFNRATAAVQLKNWRSATEDSTTAINLNDGYLKAYRQRAKCYQQLGRHQEAVRDLEKVVQLHDTPENKKLLQDARNGQPDTSKNLKRKRSS